VSRPPTSFGSSVGAGRSDPVVEEPPPPGQAPVVAAALAIGLLLLGVQLWLLTIALDLFLAGRGGDLWLIALLSGLIFLGGLVVLWLLRRRPRLRRPGGAEAPFARGAWGHPPSEGA